MLAYLPGSVLAEKVEPVISGFPAVLHRLKDILDVVTLSGAYSFEGRDLMSSFRATFERRRSPADLLVLEDLRAVAGERAWATAWATMVKEKSVATPMDLREAAAAFERFARPLLEALETAEEGATPGAWPAGGPWRRE